MERGVTGLPARLDRVMNRGAGTPVAHAGRSWEEPTLNVTGIVSYSWRPKVVSSDFSVRACWSAFGSNCGRRKIQRGAYRRSSSGRFMIKAAQSVRFLSHQTLSCL